MSSKNQKLNATITIGSVLEGSVKRNIGFLKTGLSQVGNSIKEVERRQRELAGQRRVLERQGESVEALDREYAQLERRLKDLRLAQERWNRAAKASRRVGSTFRDVASDIGRNARRIALGATLAGGAIFGIASSTALLGDEVAKTADKLGFGIAGLQEFRYAAERSGVSTSVFDSSMVAMTKRIGEASQGFGSGKKALDALGLSAKEMVKLSPEAQLALIADRMEGIESPGEKAAIAAGLFSRAGVGMVNMLREGSKGLEQLRDDARRTGYVLSEKAARDAEVFQDTLLDTQLTLKGLKNTIGTALLPVVTQAMRRIGDALVNNRESVEQWADSFADGVERVLPIVGEVALGLGRVTTFAWGVVESTAEMVGGWENFGIVVGAVLASRTVLRIAKFGIAVFSLGRAMAALALATPLVAGGIRAIGLAVVAAGPLVVGTIRAIGLAMSANPIGATITAIAIGAGLIAANWSTVEPILRPVLDWMSEKFQWLWKNAVKPTIDGMKTGAKMVGDAWNAAMAILGTAIEGIGSVLDTTWTTVIAPVVEALSSTEGIKAAWESVKAALDPVLTWVGDKFAAVMEYIKPVIEALKWALDNGKAAAGAVAGAVGLGTQKSVMDSELPTDPGRPIGETLRLQNKPGTPTLDQLVNPKLKKNALGGTWGPGWHLTGELGPELKFENRSGYVANNRALRQLAGYADRAGTMMAQGRASGNMSARVDALFSQARAPAQAASAAQQVVQNITYTINAAGASADDVIRLVERKARQAAGNGLFDRAPATGPYGR